MLAKRKTARIVVIVAIVMFGLIAGFFLWAARGESIVIDSPISTSTEGVIPTQSMETASPTP
jgi:hypothetical protein